jgi:hypothetical protein
MQEGSGQELGNIGGFLMGARSFNLWPRCEAIIDSIPDGRKHWRNKHFPLVPGEEERQIGDKMIGRPGKSKSLFVNEAIIHYHDKACGQLIKSRDALQERVFELEKELEEERKKKGSWLYQWIRGR